jgi:CRP-like cAMP-binding protein
MNPSPLKTVPRRQSAQLHAIEMAAVRRAAEVSPLGNHIDHRGLPWQPRHNRLLAALPPADYERLRRALQPIAMPSGQILCEAGQHPEHAIFPVSGIVSLAQDLADGATAEVAITGNDGVVGVALFLGGGLTTMRAVVRAAGHGYALRADALWIEFSRCDALRHVLLRFSQALLTQVAQTAVCRSRHRVEQQVCRLLLSGLDLLRGDELALTHDTIADSLGVRRESVTVAARKLQAAGLIDYCRGRIAVLDRPELERRVCECYAVVKAESCRLARPQHGGSGRPAVIAPAIAGRHALSG